MSIFRIQIRPGNPATFDPNPQTAFVNDSVFWHNGDSEAHWPAPSASNPKGFIPFQIPPNTSSNQVTFAKVQTIPYVCINHPGETGQIVVKPASKTAFAGKTKKGALAGKTKKGAFAGNTKKGALAGNTKEGALAGNTKKGAYGKNTKKGAYGKTTKEGAFAKNTKESSFGVNTKKSAFGKTTRKSR